MMNSVFSDFIYRFKEWLRGFSFIATANRVLKANQLRVRLKCLASTYAERANRKCFIYSEDFAIAEAKRRFASIQRGEQIKKVRELRVFWVGANRDQDESGFLQALRSLATVIEFHNFTGTYGQW